MSNYVIGVASILGGVFVQALITGKIRRTEASLDYWSSWRVRHPTFRKYGPAFLVAPGILRIAFGRPGRPELNPT